MALKPTWSRDGIDLYLGDCLEVLPQLPDRCVESVVSDPPYGVEIAGWDSDIPPQAALDECLRIASGPVMWFGAATKVLEFAKYEPRPERMMVWAPSFTLAKTSKGRAFYRFHPIWVWRHPKSQKGLGTDVLRHKCDGRNWWNHPGTKPIELIRDCLEFANSEWVMTCDPFMGSGTTIVAAIETQRRAIGIEKDPHYFWDICVPRVEKALAERKEQLPLGVEAAG